MNVGLARVDARLAHLEARLTRVGVGLAHMNLRPTRIIFEQLYGAMPENVPEGLEERLESHSDRLAADGARQRRGLTLWIRRYVMSAAAAVMVCGIAGTILYKTGVFDTFPAQQPQAMTVDTYDNPKRKLKKRLIL